MLPNILLYAGSAAIVFWGAMHIVKTKAVVAGFEPLSRDNRLVLTMEWIMEGLTLCFIGLLVAVLTLAYGATESVALLVYRLSALMLVIMAGVSMFTGAQASPLPYKLCPPIFGGTGMLWLLASWV